MSSINKYAQFFRNSGFFAGSKIKTQVTDGTYIGKEIILSKGTDIIQTMTVPTDGKVEFFTDESGEVIVSCDNGVSTISATVNITSYATYNVVLNGADSDNTRQAYAKDVELSTDRATARIAYTGDKSVISAVASKPSLVSLSIDGTKINIRDAGKNMQGKCSITATIAATQKYDSADVTFNVNKLTGIYGTWAEATDETIVSMIQKADMGDIDLAEFWAIGEERRVHLNPIAEGTEVAEQVEQDIDLVIMHNPLGDSKYMLTTPTQGNRYQPHFIIGTKECLENKTAMGYFEKSITAVYNPTIEYTYNSYMPIDATTNAELIDMLNDEFVFALPEYLQSVLKSTNRYYVCSGGSQNEVLSYGKISYTSTGTKSHKVSLINLKELGLVSNVQKNNNIPYTPQGIGVYNAVSDYYGAGSLGARDYDLVVPKANDNVNNCGTKFSYYNGNSIVKKKGIDGNAVDYLLADAFMLSYKYSSASIYKSGFSTAFYIDSNGNLATNTLTDIGTRTKLRGVSPIMFI